MFKLYKNLRAKDWFLIIFLTGLTVLQVYFTMTLVDKVQAIIEAITYLDYHNHPEKLGEAFSAFISAVGWGGVTSDSLAAVGISGEAAERFLKMATATVGDIWKCGGLMLCYALLSALTQMVVGFIASYVASSLTTTIRSKVYAKINEFSAREINDFSTASLITRATNDVQQVQITNVMALRMVVAAPITAIWAIAKIHATSMELTVAVAASVIILIVAIACIMAAVLPVFKKTQKLTDDLNGVTRENLTGIRIVKAYNAENYVENKFENVNRDFSRMQLFTSRVMGLMSPVMTLVMNGVSLAIYWIGASLINKGTTDYATVTSFMMLSSQIIMSFMMLMMMFVLFPRAQVSAGRINKVLESKSDIIYPSEDEKTEKTGEIEFDNVSFGYTHGQEDVIRNISFKVHKGETVAFIGATGSGKTTLINLIPRLYDVTEGSVKIDGVDVKDMTEGTLRKKVAVVPQKGLLFSGTVKDNIAFCNPEMPFGKIERAAKIAEADGFINEMPEKYNATISQGGKNVSGGQRQRLCIARAVAADAEILVFDDSFSALDYKTDKKVRENLASEAKGVTKVVVAQRIGTIMDADLIVVLEDGKAVGQGKHAELLKNCETYREIALSQLSKEELGL